MLQSSNPGTKYNSPKWYPLRYKVSKPLGGITGRMSMRVAGTYLDLTWHKGKLEKVGTNKESYR